MQNPELFRIAELPWQFFVTLTFRRERVPARYRISMFKALIRQQSKIWGVHFRKVLWVLRAEKGDQTGRFHFHALIAGLPLSAVTKRNCLAMQSQWEKLGGGIARVRVYVGTLDGAEYVLKEMGSESIATATAKDNHEVTKFGHLCEVTLSMSVVRLCAARIARYVRQTLRPAHCKTGESPLPYTTVTEPRIAADTAFYPQSA